MDFGSTRSDGNSIYARRENQVFTVASTVVEDLSREAEAYREPHLVRFDRGAVTELDGEFAHGNFSVARKDGGWSMAGRPLTAHPSTAAEFCRGAPPRVHKSQVRNLPTGVVLVLDRAGARAVVQRAESLSNQCAHQRIRHEDENRR